MVSLMELREPKAHNPPLARPFGLGVSGIALHEIMRLLVGNTNVYDHASLQTLRITNNELRSGSFRGATPQAITKLLFDNNVNVTDYGIFLTRVAVRNTRFFSQLRAEVMMCLVAKKRKRYVESFLYLYRALEYTAIAFPLLFALSHQEFSASHRFLQSLMIGKGDSDLKIIERAIPELAAQAGLGAVTFDFSIAGKSIEFITSLKKELGEAVFPTLGDLEFEPHGDILFKVEFNKVPALFHSLRNRMFHYKINERNIDLSAVGGADELCSIFIEELLYWFSLTYSEVVRVLARQTI
jgi:hypothetical protein